MTKKQTSLLFALVWAATAATAAERIVFCSNRTGPWRIWSIAPDGADPKQLTKGDAEYQDVDPMVSPDGKSVLFTSTRGGAPGVWILNMETGERRRVCDGDQAEWSPDGNAVVFRRNERILTRKLADGTEKILTPKDWPHCSGPAWSPDGKRIAFAARWNAGNAVYIVPVDGGGPPVKVYDREGACEPHWSPDGKRIVFETETHIRTIAPDGAKNRLITYFGGVQRYARFSPDGKFIVFCQGASERGPWEIYVIPARGGAPRRLTTGGSDMYPHWSRR